MPTSSVRFSALRLNPALPGEDQERESRYGVNLPVMAFAALVTAAVGNGNRHSLCLPVSSSAFALKRFAPTSAPAVGQVHPVRLDVIRRRFQERGFSSQVIELLLASTRSSTANAYQFAWNAWLHWNVARGFNLLSYSIAKILQYLNDKFCSGLASQTINSHRSMLSMTLDPIEGSGNTPW